MATEFQMHPAGIIETGSSQPGISTIMIPRLTPKQVKSVNNSRAVPLIHYTGPKKVLPPAISKNIEISYDEVCARQISLEAAQKKDVEWLNSLMKGQDAMEWNGFNNYLARSQNVLKPASILYMFGPLIDAPPSHPDTRQRKWRDNISPAFPMGSSTLVVALLLQCLYPRSKSKTNSSG